VATVLAVRWYAGPWEAPPGRPDGYATRAHYLQADVDRPQPGAFELAGCVNDRPYLGVARGLLLCQAIQVARPGPPAWRLTFTLRQRRADPWEDTDRAADFAAFFGKDFPASCSG
jgi:hypothetical protein